MFDAATSRLLRAAPVVPGVDPELLPQELTRVYAELVAVRLGGARGEADQERHARHDRLRTIATVYEALADTGAEGEARRAAAFVAASAYQILGRVSQAALAEGRLLAPGAIHPELAAPLLFLIAQQSPDAREAGRRLAGAGGGDLLRDALVETVSDLAAERFEEVLARAERLQRTRPVAEADLSEQAVQALYGLCWTGVVLMVAKLLGRAAPASTFRQFDDPDATFAEVERLSVSNIDLPGAGARLVSAYAGPRHLARLLGQVSQTLNGAGLSRLPAPAGANADEWGQWIAHRVKTKPLIWPNHRAAVDGGFLDQGRSAVIVYPTGAGKTTLSELKIAATLSTGRKVIFLVPTLALVDQLRDDLADSFPSDLGGVVVSADGDLAILADGPELSQIEVMTPERLLAMLSFADADVSEVGLIVFDECHLLSPQGGGTRSVDAMLALLHANQRAPEADLLLLSAMLTNGQEMADWVATLTGRPADFIHDPWKPSRQARGVVIYPQAQLDPLRTFARAKERGLDPPRPSTKASAHALFGLRNNWVPGSPQDVTIVALAEAPVDLRIGTYGATPNANGVAADLAVLAVAAGLKTIVFVQQAGHAVSTARALEGRLAGVAQITAAEGQLTDDIALELGPTGGSLVKPFAGALPHNGDMLPLERRLAESLFKRADGPSVIVATPTLAQGMNLPAQLAILAGNMRHDDRGREELEQHELLNAAGRAGRAGHLANGSVLLIPEPVVGFDARGTASFAALTRLRAILPDSDQCVRIDDPLADLLDQIALGQPPSVEVRYFLSRLRAGVDDAEAVAAALSLMRKSLAAYRAAVQEDADAFTAKVAALEAALNDDVQQVQADALRISAFTGMPSAAVQAMADRLDRDLEALPGTVAGWIDWLIDFLRDDEISRAALLDRDVEVATAVARGKKAGGPMSAAEFDVLRSGLKAWIAGRPFDGIEAALGVAPGSVGACGRARDLALKFANRRFYMIAAAVAELAKTKLAVAEIAPANPAVLEILPIALRKGFDSVEVAAFGHLNPTIRTRVGVHRAFAARLGGLASLPAASFRDVLNRVEAHLAFGNLPPA
jgi:ATP-dependent RNA helicase HelY